MARIDTHAHLIPADYRTALRRAGIEEAGGRALPDWSPELALAAMAELDVATAILSVSTLGTTFLSGAADAAALARDLNDYCGALVASQPNRFGFFATVPMPHVAESTAEAVRALDELHADGVVLLANNAGVYLGEDSQDELFAALDARSAVVFIHPADLPGPTVPGTAPFAADFLLDTTRVAYLLVRNEIRRRYPNIRFILSHAGGSFHTHRIGWRWRSWVTPVAVRRTASTTSPASTSTRHCPRVRPHCRRCWPSRSRVTSRSDRTSRSHRSPPVRCSRPGWRTTASDAADREAIDRGNALRLFPRLGSTPPPRPQPLPQRLRHDVSRHAMRAVARLINAR